MSNPDQASPVPFSCHLVHDLETKCHHRTSHSRQKRQKIVPLEFTKISSYTLDTFCSKLGCDQDCRQQSQRNKSRILTYCALLAPALEKILFKAKSFKVKSSIPVSDPQVATFINHHHNEAFGKDNFILLKNHLKNWLKCQNSKLQMRHFGQFSNNVEFNLFFVDSPRTPFFRCLR